MVMVIILTLPFYFLHFLTHLFFFLQHLKFVDNLCTPLNESMDSTDEFSLSTEKGTLVQSRVRAVGAKISEVQRQDSCVKVEPASDGNQRRTRQSVLLEG